MVPVLLINPFEIPKGKEDECLAFWGQVAEDMRRQPGFVSTRLHRAMGEGAHFRFINVAEWNSAEDLEAAVNSKSCSNWYNPIWEFSHISQGCTKLSAPIKGVCLPGVRGDAGSLFWQD